ncbi:MAG: nitrogenase component 1 [Elusimicrobiota bacterium]
MTGFPTVARTPAGRQALSLPGKAGLRFFKSLLRRRVRGWELDCLAFSEDGVEFSLVRGAAMLTFEAVPPGPGARACLLSGATLGLNLRGGPETVAEAGELPDAVFRALANKGFSGLRSMLVKDALAHAGGDGPRTQTRLERYFRIADHTPDWWKFVYPKNDFLDQEARLGSRCVKVNHGTWECRFNTVEHDLAGLRFFSDLGSDEPGGLLDVQTGLDEGDVTGGGSLRRLAEALETAVRELRPDCIQLNSTCLPELLGEDPRPLIARIERRHKVPVYWTSKTRDSGRSVTDAARRMLSRIQFSRCRDPRRVLLAGAGSPWSRSEAVRLVEGLGLSVAGFLYPEIAPAAAPGIESCGSVVWVNPAGWERISDEPFLERGFLVVRHAAPFGLAATEAWLRRIREVLGLRARRRFAPEADGVVRRLRPLCGRWKAALIGDETDAAALASGAAWPGFSVAGLLAEMGFQTRFFVHGTGKGPVGFRTFGFGAAKELDRLLREEADLAFTHFNHDPRLESTRVAGFCETAFAVGIAGALRSGLALDRLAAFRPFPAHAGLLRPWT